MMYYPITHCSKRIEDESAIVQNSTTEKNNNQIYLPAEVWVHIVRFCDIQTTCRLSMLCKFNYLLITPIMQRKIEHQNYQQKVPNNCLSYSLTSYETFIAPILENLDIETKIKIDEYLQQNKDTKNIDKNFCDFVFQQLDATAKKIRTAKGLVTQSCLKKVINFIVHSASNHCAIIFENSNHLIYICQINSPLNFKKLDTINCLDNNEYINTMQFTPGNNFLVVVNNIIERNSVKYVLFQLNLENDNKIVKLWEHKINYTIDDDNTVESFNNKAIMFPNSEDKKLFLIIGKKTYLFKIEDTSYSIQDFIVPYNKPFRHKNTDNFIFSSNGLELAVIEDYDFDFEDIQRLNLFSQSGNAENFIEKSLPKIQACSSSVLEGYSYLRNLQFNKLGNICVFIDGSYNLIMLNKINGEWYCAMLLLDQNYFCLGLTFDEKNLIIKKTCKDTKKDNVVKNLEIMSIEDKLLKSISSPCYIRKYCDITPIKYKNFYPLVQNTTTIHHFTMHPSGLAVFAYNSYDLTNTVNVIIPSQLTKEEKKYLPLKKVAYYAKKIFM